MSNSMPIGILDSGVGGLSIVKEIRKLMPYENIIYFADSAYCPYGDKPKEFIKHRVFTLCDFLIHKGAKILVIACNTASIVSLDDLRKHYAIPIVGVEPAVKPAVQATKTGIIGVLATSVSLSGNRFASLVKRFCTKTRVITQPCPGLVELVEQGEINSIKTKKLLYKYLTPLIAENADTIVLGCTHYPFLKPLIYEIIGNNDIKVIDTGKPVAKQTLRVLKQMNLLNAEHNHGKEMFFSSKDSKQNKDLIKYLWENSQSSQ
ncbi:glutamate racemase [Peptococcaceae bacterium]|nr:glutamate racemase [Peptococcaceae bacterium]MCL0077993.1 glutamate racemase [Peptococcaceae bacterium]